MLAMCSIVSDTEYATSVSIKILSSFKEQEESVSGSQEALLRKLLGI